MTAFFDLSSLIRAIFALWALSLCLVNIVSAALAFAKKKYRFFSIAILLFASIYFIWQVIFDLSLFEKTGTVTEVAKRMGEWNLGVWLVAFIALTVAAIFVLVYNIRYANNYVTPNSIKEYLDKMPCGVCCWRDNGRVLFYNVCMFRLCLAVTDEPLLNGNHFYEAVGEEIRNVDGELWRFACRDIIIGGERLHEMIASNVTIEYAKTQALEKDKAELSRLNSELQEYTLGIDETVRRQEILQAKVNIHDEMNRLMLSTMAAESGDAETLDEIFSLWEQNAFLLCMEAEGANDKYATERIKKLAEALKIKLKWQEIPSSLSEKQRVLFYSAAQEAVANAAKHAQAENMTIFFEEGEGKVACFFSNDGRIPVGPARLSGGLANLTRLAAEQGATISVDVDDRFTLSLTFEIEREKD